MTDFEVQQFHGSSPRVWGPPSDNERWGVALRFIPTRVGTTSADNRGDCASPVHPHACGDHITTSAQPGKCPGSSPRVWGPRLLLQLHHVAVRFIPTRVGTTQREPPPAAPQRFIPTRVGTTLTGGAENKETVGSSPRVWGPLLEIGRNVDRGRFIPTRVGTTHQLGLYTRPRSVHPHACGDHFSVPFAVISAERFIPTRVGSTEEWPLLQPRVAVHPHACGEHACSGRRAVGAHRFIPTRVGTTP